MLKVGVQFMGKSVVAVIPGRTVRTVLPAVIRYDSCDVHGVATPAPPPATTPEPTALAPNEQRVEQQATDDDRCGPRRAYGRS